MNTEKIPDTRDRIIAQKLRRKNKCMLQQDDDVKRPAAVCPGDFPAHSRHLSPNPRRRIDDLQPGCHSGSSMITKPALVPRRGANSPATGSPLAHTSAPALVKPSQPALSR